MNQILELFKTPEQVQRVIQKVIDYQHSSPEELSREIDEYVVTEHIRESFDDILEWIDRSSETPGAETGAWVSGFYGSGKSSFSKYLGYALERELLVEGAPFVDRFAARFDSKTTAQRLKTLSKRFDAAVIMLDLASQSYSSMSDVSDVLYLHTLKELGYCSKSVAIANFEILLEEEGKAEQFRSLYREQFGKDWDAEHNKVMLSRGRAKKIAEQLYPGQTIELDDQKSGIGQMNGVEKAERIISMVRRKTGKESIFFVIDEVGQYLAPREKAILDMDGLAKNMRNLGGGKVFIIATAQQTLTATKAGAINSLNLYKLKDRFPKAVTLESSDIEEICTRRLLKKSPEGATLLAKLFDESGARFTSATKLKKCPAYDTGVCSAERFAQLYPFTPKHFRILLSLLSELSVSTGGVGLRSAIKVVQDVLIHGEAGRRLVDAPVGRLVTVENFFDELRLDILRSHPSVLTAAEKTLDWSRRQERDGDLAARVAKALAITGILKDFPATPFNVAALLQSDLTAPVAEEAVAQILARMAADASAPVAEDGSGAFHYLSDRLVELDGERRRFDPYPTERIKLESELMKTIFSPVSSVQTDGGLSVKVSLWLRGALEAVTEKGAPIRLELAFYAPGGRDELLKEVITASRREPHCLTFLAVRPNEFDEQVTDVLRSRHMSEAHGQSEDKEISDYAKEQSAKAERDIQTLRQRLIASLNEGELVRAGQSRPLNPSERMDFTAALREELRRLATAIFHKHWFMGKAAAQTDTAHRFITTLDRKYDPLGLITTEGNQPVLRAGHSVVNEIREWIKTQQGATTGARIFDRFRGAPYGWSSENILCALAGMFWGGLVSFTISGIRHETRERAVEDVLRAPRNFNTVGVSIRKTDVTQDDLILAGTFLTGLGVASVVYTLEGIASARSAFAKARRESIMKLAALVRETGVYGAERLDGIERALREIEEAPVTDFIEFVKDAEKCSVLHGDLDWLTNLLNAEAKGVFEDIRAVRDAERRLQALPDDYRERVKPSPREVRGWLLVSDFVNYGDEFRRFAQSVKDAVDRSGKALARENAASRKALSDAVDDAIGNRGLDKDEAAELRDAIGRRAGAVAKEESIALLKEKAALGDARTALPALVREILKKRPAPVTKEPRSVRIPRRITTDRELGELINRLQAVRDEMDRISEIEITLE